MPYTPPSLIVYGFWESTLDCWKFAETLTEAAKESRGQPIYEFQGTLLGRYKAEMRQVLIPLDGEALNHEAVRCPENS